MYVRDQVPIIMSGTNENDKKRKAEGNLNTELLIEIKGARVENAEILAKLIRIEKLLTDKVGGSDPLEKSGKNNHEDPTTKAEEDSELSGDEEDSVVDSNDAWMNMYRQLRSYRIINGDCKVPQRLASNPKLGAWVRDQKSHYANLKFGKKGYKLPTEKVIKLERLGFFWGKKFPEPSSWDERFEEVKKYKTAMRCEPAVNVNATNPTPIAIWVSTQRSEYRRFKKGRDSLLTMEQIGQLNDIGFNWKGPRMA